MSNTSKSPKATTLARVQALISGLQKHFPNGSFTLGKASFTTASLVQVLQGLADAINAVNAAQANAKNTVLALQGARAKVGPVMLDLKRLLLVTFGTDAEALADFGLEPTKARKPRTSEQNAAAAAKNKVTRAARGTKSKKQKLVVRGDVTGVHVTPITSHADPTPRT
jgi:hypothetical protein